MPCANDSGTDESDLLLTELPVTPSANNGDTPIVPRTDNGDMGDLSPVVPCTDDGDTGDLSPVVPCTDGGDTSNSLPFDSVSKLPADSSPTKLPADLSPTRSPADNRQGVFFSHYALCNVP